MSKHKKVHKHSAMEHVLKGLIPYTKENFALAYKPSLFFNELERIDREVAYLKSRRPTHNRTSLISAFSRAKKQGFISFGDDGYPRLTEKGEMELQLYEPKKLKNAKLLVIFDVEEKYRSTRNKLRRVLVALKFTQVQKSVWVSEYDGRRILLEEKKRLHLGDEVRIYEAHEL